MAVVALLSGTLVLSGVISWRYASNLYGKEKQIRSNDILREAFIGKTRSALSVKDLEGHYLYSNEVWGQMVRLPEKDIEGKTDFDLFPIMQATIQKKQDDQILQGGDRVEFDDILIAADGASKFTVMKLAMRTRSGRIYGVGTIAHDVTNVLSTESAAVKIEDAYNGGQWKQVGELAHTLKSSSRSVGALALSEVCAELESAGKNDDESQIHSAMAGFSQSLHADMESIGQLDS